LNPKPTPNLQFKCVPTPRDATKADYFSFFLAYLLNSRIEQFLQFLPHMRRQ